jgi:hypothetical protein
VYLRDDDEEYEGTVFLSEVGPDGRRLRQVEVSPDGEGVREQDFPIDPPVDLRDPQYFHQEISAEEFERAWTAAGAGCGWGGSTSDPDEGVGTTVSDMTGRPGPATSSGRPATTSTG